MKFNYVLIFIYAQMDGKGEGKKRLRRGEGEGDWIKDMWKKTGKETVKKGDETLPLLRERRQGEGRQDFTLTI